MDLVTDFKKINTEGKEKILKYLKTIYIDPIGDEKEKFYLEIDKYYRALVIWSKELCESYTSVDREKLLNSILQNYCFMIHNIAVYNEKILYFLLRNSIEAFIRYVTNNVNGRDLERMFSDISEGGNDTWKSYIQIYTSQLKQVYDTACQYIHSDMSKIEADIFTLIELQNEKKEDLPKILRQDFIKVNVAMLSILKLKYNIVYNKIRDNAKGYLTYVIPLKDRLREEKCKENNG